LQRGFRARGEPGSIGSVRAATRKLVVQRNALATAEELDRRVEGRSVDFYYHATLNARTDGCRDSDKPMVRRHCRLPPRPGRLLRRIALRPLDPRGQLTLRGTDRTISINYYGFAWLPSDFNQLALAERFRSRDLKNHHKTAAWAVARWGENSARMSRSSALQPLR
jgi:hypothetical protein